MKNQFIKSALFLLGVSVLFTACVATDDLAGMEELQNATVNNKLSDAKQTDINNKQAIANEVYNMQTEVADLKAAILGLQVDSNQIKFLAQDYRLKITVDSAASIANNQVLDKLKAASGVDYTTVINGLYNDVSTANSALEASKLVYDTKLDIYNIAGAKATSSANKYSATVSQKDNAANDTANALSGYASRDALTLAINRSNARLVDYKAVMLQFKASVDALLIPYKAASAERDSKRSKVLEAQAIVDNDLLNGVTSVPHTDALTLASTNYDIANVEYGKAKTKYESAAAELTNALADLTSEQTSNAGLVKMASDYDVAKPIFATANNSLSALLAAKNADEVAYENTRTAKEDAATAKAIAQATYDANNGALTLVKADKATLTSAIAGIRATENATQKSWQENKDVLAQLTTAGYNTNTGQIVKEWIAATQEKIKALEAIIATYKA